MAGKKGKSGKGAGPGKIGVRGGKGKGGEKRLAEVVERQGSMIGEGRALVKRGDGAYDLLDDMIRDGDFWTNGSARIRCGKKGLEESSWKVWEDEEMVDTFDGKVVKKEKVEEEEEVVERQGSMIGEGRALVKRGDGAYDLLEDRVRDGVTILVSSGNTCSR